MGRTLGLDVGTKTIGVAVSDLGLSFATPRTVIRRVKFKQDALALKDILDRERCGAIVIGLPLNMDDSAGPQARKAVEWGRGLEARSGKPVVFVDERLSSFEAEQQLIDRKRGGERLTRQRKKEQLDALAAASFLQAFLDGKLSAYDL